METIVLALNQEKSTKEWQKPTYVWLQSSKSRSRIDLEGESIQMQGDWTVRL